MIGEGGKPGVLFSLLGLAIGLGWWINPITPAISGAAVAWPGATRAQKALPVIGYLASGLPNAGSHVAAFNKGLGEAGYVDGQNVAIEYRWAEGDYSRLPAMAADLVAHGVDVIAAMGGPSGSAAKAATSTTPIVFTGGIDPVATGLVASLARPGGNVTVSTSVSWTCIPSGSNCCASLSPKPG